MASTKKINTKLNESGIKSLYIGILSDKENIENRIAEYEKQSNKKFPYKFSKVDDYDYVNPQHYVQEDGRQTWERMVDKFGLEKTAIFCELNAYKYKERIGKKPNESTEREQKKIDWYERKAEELYLMLEEEKKKKNKGIF